MNQLLRSAVPTLFLLSASLAAACAGDQKAAPTQADVASGDALPAAPPVPAEPASTDSPATASAPVVEQSSATKPAPAPAVEQKSLTEAQIALFTELANGGEVEQGKVAQSKAKAPAVKQFAAMMVKHHSEAQQEQAKLFKKLNLTTAESPAAAELKADGDKTLTALKESSPADFDRTYIAAQVEAHEKVLKAIDEKLLPAAHDAELTTGLRKLRATVEAHLTQAKTLQGQLK